MREETIAGLQVRFTGGTDRNGGGDGPLVVLMHGFGAPGTDLVPLARVLDVPREVRFADIHVQLRQQQAAKGSRSPFRDPPQRSLQNRPMVIT